MSDPQFSEQPAPRSGRQPPSPAPFDHNAALRKYLAHLDSAIEWCCDHPYDHVAAYSVAARLIKTSLAVGAALNQAPDRQFTHRIVVEHVTPPHLPKENLKTIHGVCSHIEPQD